MVRVEETALPGVGMRYDFDGRYGKRVGVIVHRDGRRELFVSEKDDPDACAMSIMMSEEEANVVSDLMGGSTVTRRIGQAMQDIDGLAIDWIQVSADSPFVGRSIGDSMLRTRTGASIVAVFRQGQTVPAPEPSFALEAQDTLVVVGTPDGLRQSWMLLTGAEKS